MRLLTPTILLIIAVLSFVMYTNPAYKDVQKLKAQAGEYNQALSNSQELQAERDALSEKYRSFPQDSLNRLNELLPDSADNIRLIINIQRIAQAYGMTLSAIKFDATASTDKPANQLAAGSPAALADQSKLYGTFHLEFTTTTNYTNFLKFMKDMETSLRLVDIESIDFMAGDFGTSNYTYTVKLKTYWLKG
jgi:Tfp pilus assembly protein PilO